ncbi:aminopeptidase P N-terminal domain-containing protein [Tundrisphaera lichenicola]|uniref:aminopeptidase P N-terminal domain-containing protein n=1 Tax=Tundrisphaera lichenicola TaxID=2029860 RepID=UPI003EC0075E
MALPHSWLTVILFLGLLGPAGLPEAESQDPQPASPPVEVAFEGPSKSEYRERRAALMQKIKEEEAPSIAMRAALEEAGKRTGPAPGSAGVVVVLIGAGEPGEDEKFRQSNDFAYLTGVESPHAAMILWPETGDETLYLPPRNPSAERWEGPRPGPGPEGVSATGFSRVESTASFLSDLFRAIGDSRTGGRSQSATVYLLEPDAKLPETPTARFAEFLREGAPSSRMIDVGPKIHAMRKVKSEAEAALLRRAIAITADAHREVIRLIRPGIPEYQLEGAILGAFVAGGGPRAGFPSIVGSGPNSTTLHYYKNDRTLQDGDLVVVDIGGEYRGYTADITRTYPANGRFTPRQLEVYRLVLEAQTAAADDFQPGVSTIASLTQAATRVLKDSPLRARDEEGTEQTMDHFFIHGLGHQLGLEVHDVGDTREPLGPGEVFTIEPGIYLPSEGFGVRIEDDYRVTKDGLEKLSRDIPVEPADLERLIERKGSP